MANSLWKQTLHVANLIKALILACPHCYHSVFISPLNARVEFLKWKTQVYVVLDSS